MITLVILLRAISSKVKMLWITFFYRTLPHFSLQKSDNFWKIRNYLLHETVYFKHDIYPGKYSNSYKKIKMVFDQFSDLVALFHLHAFTYMTRWWFICGQTRFGGRKERWNMVNTQILPFYQWRRKCLAHCVHGRSLNLRMFWKFNQFVLFLQVWSDNRNG